MHKQRMGWLVGATWLLVGATTVSAQTAASARLPTPVLAANSAPIRYSDTLPLLREPGKNTSRHSTGILLSPRSGYAPGTQIAATAVALLADARYGGPSSDHCANDASDTDVGYGGVFKGQGSPQRRELRGDGARTPCL